MEELLVGDLSISVPYTQHTVSECFLKPLPGTFDEVTCTNVSFRQL